MESSPFLASDSLNLVTPFPAEPSLHRRVEYQNRRLIKLTKACMKAAGLSDKEENKADKPMDNDTDPGLEERPGEWDPIQDAMKFDDDSILLIHIARGLATVVGSQKWALGEVYCGR